MSLLEARVAETSLQRTQIEELIQSLARSRDENVLADVDAAIRVAMQQTAITGSSEPLVVTLKQADERLARFNQPRLERVRRAMAQDLETRRSARSTNCRCCRPSTAAALRGLPRPRPRRRRVQRRRRRAGARSCPINGAR
jgi:hypothetical protein